MQRVSDQHGRPLDGASGHGAIMAELARLCAAAGSPDTAKFYAWSQSGLWRVPDRSEPGPMDIGANRDDMQAALELDVLAYARLQARRCAIQKDAVDLAEPAWSLAIRPDTRAILAHAGIDPSIAFDSMEDTGIGASGMRVDSVTHRRGCVLTSVHIGRTDHGTVVYDAFEDRSEIRIAGMPLPETMLAALRGAPLSQIMPHHVLDALDIPIAGAGTAPGWDHGTVDVILRLETSWEPLVADHPHPRPWLTPLPLPSYV